MQFNQSAIPIARVACCIGSRAYTDLLTLVREGNRWSIISKVFHYDSLPAQRSSDR